MKIYRIIKWFHFQFRFIKGILCSLFIPNKIKRLEFCKELTFSNTDKVLILVPHFDDEILACSGLIYYCLKSGIDLNILYISDGARGGVKNCKSDFLYSKKRSQESILALNDLKSNNNWLSINYLDIPDQQISNRIRDVLDAVSKIEFNAIFVPYSNDPHPDHKSLFQISDSILNHKHVERYEYYVHSNQIDYSNVTHFSVAPFGKVTRALYRFKTQIYIDFDNELINRRKGNKYYTFYKSTVMQNGVKGSCN
ncbi:PIG-L deacetylase family protein [Acetobacteroides hydrogenigenes]|nr:PIG-L family deacetylase [Acetobacteroides hydrogenigenes]